MHSTEWLCIGLNCAWIIRFKGKTIGHWTAQAIKRSDICPPEGMINQTFEVLIRQCPCYDGFLQRCVMHIWEWLKIPTVHKIDTIPQIMVPDSALKLVYCSPLRGRTLTRCSHVTCQDSWAPLQTRFPCDLFHERSLTWPASYVDRTSTWELATERSAILVTLFMVELLKLKDYKKIKNRIKK
jgi:hypothetical protein